MSETPTRLLDRNSLELKCNQLERENASLREQLRAVESTIAHLRKRPDTLPTFALTAFELMDETLAALRQKGGGK